jgi:putative transposase
VRRLVERFAVRERHACGLVGLSRSVCRYEHRRRVDEERSSQRLGELAAERRRFGYRRLHSLLGWEGYRGNHKRVERLYRAAGLAVRKRPRQRGTAEQRAVRRDASGPDEQWSLAFVSDVLAAGRRLRLLAVVDPFTREAWAMEVDTSLAGERGVPEAIVLDKGPALTSRVMDQWAYQQGVRLRFITPSKPVQNAFVESCKGRRRDECLNEHWFVSLADARRSVEAWRLDSTQQRPHSALGYQTALVFRQRSQAASGNGAAAVGLS